MRRKEPELQGQLPALCPPPSSPHRRFKMFCIDREEASHLLVQSPKACGSCNRLGLCQSAKHSIEAERQGLLSLDPSPLLTRDCVSGKPESPPPGPTPAPGYLKAGKWRQRADRSVVLGPREEGAGSDYEWALVRRVTTPTKPNTSDKGLSRNAVREYSCEGPVQ